MLTRYKYKMNIKRNIIVEGNGERSIPVDVYIPKGSIPKPVVLFAHGFKGFKDWGIWDLVARSFVKAGFVFLKFNFSHNGTSPEHLLDFVDLDAFGRNNYTLELEDLDLVLGALQNGQLIEAKEIDRRRIFIIGHSRGGGITAIKAAADERIAAWLGWASVKDLAYAWRGNETLISEWRAKGVYEIKNGRTKQMMPLYYQLYEDFVANEQYYSVERAIRSMNKPMLVIHGTEDPAVSVKVTTSFKEWNASLKVRLIQGADHVFGGRHPNVEKTLPAHAAMLVNQSIDFLRQC